MSELNIKKFDFMAINIAQSAEIFHLMADLCQALINQRHFFIMDRIAQFVHVFKDLLQAVCWYKSKRNKTDNLEAAEVTMLAEIAHKLEKYGICFQIGFLMATLLLHHFLFQQF